MSFPGATPDLPPINAQNTLTINSSVPSLQQPCFSQWREGFEQRRFNRNLIRGRGTEQKNPHRSFNIEQEDLAQIENERRRKKRKPVKERSWKNIMFKLSLTYFAQRYYGCLLYTSPSPRDGLLSRMPSSA